MATITESGIKTVIELLIGAVTERYTSVSKGWPGDMKNAGDKVIGIVNEEVVNFTSGDLTALREALVADIVHALKTGKGQVSKSLADLA